jgi:hypothetical protein
MADAKGCLHRAYGIMVLGIVQTEDLLGKGPWHNVGSNGVEERK